MSDNTPVLLDFYFMRHAESEANARQVANGSTEETMLTQKGEKQAYDAGRFLSGQSPRVGSIYHTQMHRAAQSALNINASLNVPVYLAGNFNEQELGDWEGIDWDEAAEHFLSGEDPPNGETYKDFHSRLMDGLQTVARESQNLEDGTVPLIVSHGGVWMAINKICGQEPDHWPENCDIYQARIVGSWDNPQLQTRQIYSDTSDPGITYGQDI